MTIKPIASRFDLLICPICQSQLQNFGKFWQCTGDNPKNPTHKQRKHSFDVAKQGYVNLLPVQHKHSKNPGDSEQAIIARKDFLTKGFYQTFRDNLLAQALPLILADGQDFCWLDVGCGEGYYSQAIFEQLLTKNPTACGIALDISKPAVMATAKQLKQLKNRVGDTAQLYSMVASASQIPLADNSVDVLSTVFSPILPVEFCRVLKKGGHLLIGKPNVGHLYQMRQAIFDRVDEHDSDKFVEQLSPLFALQSEHQVRYDVELDSVALADLLLMTPYAYRAKPEKIQALLALCEKRGAMTFTVDFVIYLLKKQ